MFDESRFNRIAEEYKFCYAPLDQVSNDSFHNVVAYIGRLDVKLAKSLPVTCKWLQIASHGANGFDDISIYKNSRIVVTRIVDVFSKPIANFCVSSYHLFNSFALRHLFDKHLKLQDCGDSDNSNVLIFGYGNIGRSIALSCQKQGWKVFRFWETDIIKEPDKCLNRILHYMNTDTQTSDRIAITKMCGSNKVSMQMYGPHSLNEDGTIIPFNEQMAIVSHYLHNQGYKYAKPYESKAEGLIEDIYNVHNKPTENNCVSEGYVQYSLFSDLFAVPFLPIDKPIFTFIDLFAGIGGFRMAMQNLGGKCVFSSEWDTQAQKTYLLNYGEVPFGDITKETTKEFIPDDFDVLCAGFPCQAFSLAGKRLGFEETRGTLFFDVAEIIRRKRPKAFFLENVKGLLIHDKGKTIQTILKVLRDDLDYYVPDPQIVNAMNFGVPQHRERIYIGGFRKDQNVKEFTYPTPTDTTKTFADIKEEHTVSAKYYLSTQYVKTLVAHKERHAAKGNGFGYEIIPDDGIANAIVVGGMGRERNLVIDNRLEDFTPVTNIKGEINRDGLRRMTPREWARLQGFPDNFIIGVADASAYKQFGNSVAVPAIQATAQEIIKRIKIK